MSTGSGPARRPPRHPSLRTKLIRKSGGIAAFTAAFVLLAGCALHSPHIPVPKLGGSGAAGAAAVGFVAADEPQAGAVARQILAQGGTAGDAAVALYFSLAATYPQAAGLGGGGLCLVRNESGEVESISFLAKAPAGGGPIAVPGNVRGMAALYAQLGAFRWSRDVGAAARLAGAKSLVSEAFASEITSFSPAATKDPAIAALLRRPDGTPVKAGDRLDQSRLGTTLATIAASGPAAFYRGALARDFVKAATAKGGAVTLADLEGMRATLSPADRVDWGGLGVAIPSLSTGAGQLAAATLTAARGARSRSEVAAAVAHSLQSLGPPPTDVGDYGSTSFLVVDGAGRAVSCAVTMNGKFGAYASVPNTGILMAANPAQSPAGYGAAFLDPMIASDSKGALSLVAAASGSDAGLAGAVDALRIHRANAMLSARHILAEAGRAGDARVNLLACGGKDSQQCTVAVDPHGHGLAMVLTGP